MDFFAEANDSEKSDLNPWRVLVVDDEPDVHQVTDLVMADFVHAGRKIEFVKAHSGAQAKTILAEDSDFALALIDVVMESNHEGIDLVDHIRNELGDKIMRIVLRTGQPGEAPEDIVVRDHDISDYRDKTQLGFQQLRTVLRTNLNTYESMRELLASRAALEVMTRKLGAMNAELNKANKALTRLSERDPLTDAPNRRSFEDAFERAFRASQALQTRIAILMIDIDHFKAINDRYGHQAGDSALIEVARVIQSVVLNEHDVVARYGGEEFVVLITSDQTEVIDCVAEQIRVAVSQCRVLPTDENQEAFGMTVSVGGACVIPDTEDSAPETLLKQADDALYVAKRNGRNRVECSCPANLA